MCFVITHDTNCALVSLSVCVLAAYNGKCMYKKLTIVQMFLQKKKSKLLDIFTSKISFRACMFWECVCKKNKGNLLTSVVPCSSLDY